MLYYSPKSDELYHYGILGMKWGVRKQKTGNNGKRKRIKLTTAQKVMIGMGGAGLATGATLGAIALGSRIKANKLGKQYLASTNRKPVAGVSKIADVNKLIDSINTGNRAENLGYAGLAAAGAGVIPLITLQNSYIRDKYGLKKKKKKERL